MVDLCYWPITERIFVNVIRCGHLGAKSGVVSRRVQASSRTKIT